jgi:hypothetical protein
MVAQPFLWACLGECSWEEEGHSLFHPFKGPSWNIPPQRKEDMLSALSSHVQSFYGHY